MYTSRSQTRATQLDLSNVEDNLRTFILEYRSGSRDIKQLVSSEGLRTREHISTSSKATFQAIGGIQKTLNSLTLEADVQLDQTRRERLLQSLKFPGFNERRNEVSEAYEETFQWIFMGDDGPTQEDPTVSDFEDSDWEDSDIEDIDLADPSEASWDLFSNWLSSTADIYWISGKPGSGKTTLVKYVLNHPKTAAYLDIWSPQTLIISHFFWRPGNQMQQNIKGLLCSLLYQLLDNSVAATNYVLQYIQGQRSGVKDADTDWSVSELQSIFLQILSSYERPICIFIDGLDEVDPADGPLKLLDLVEQFPRCRNTRLCLASRPEPILQRRLSAYPRLRLQDLTRADLDRYARDHIKLTGAIDDEDTVNSSWSSNAPWHPIESIVVKAEGVFLWLVLAIKSVNKGFTFGDTLAMIQERITCLPGDLTKLYKDMWNRACEDNPKAYRQTAALYFRLILLDLHPGLSILQLMLASTSTSIADQLLDAIENPLNLVPEELMLKECKDLGRRLKLYCFGLVSFNQSSSDEEIVGWYGCQYSRLWACYGQRHPNFIHRTARDFLLDTVEGKDVLGHDVSSESSILLRWFKAHLATSQLYADARIGYPRGAKSLVSHADSYTQLLQSNYGKFGPCDPNLRRIIFYFERLCSSGQLLSGLYSQTARFCGGVDFLKVAASICCGDSIWSVAKMGTLSTVTVSEILLNLCEPHSTRVLDYNRSHIEHGINTLLHQGADPNWRGTAFAPDQNFALTHSLVQTPFTAYLRRVLNGAWSTTSFEHDSIVEVLGNLHDFLSQSAHLGHAIAIDLRHSHYSDHCEFSLESSKIHSGIDMSSMDHVFASFSAQIVLQALLNYMGEVVELPRFREAARYGEIKSLIVGIQKHLDNWSGAQDYHVIGRFVLERSGQYVSLESGSEEMKPVWYVPSKECPVEITNELMEALGCLLKKKILRPKIPIKDGVISRLVHQMSWTVQAQGLDDILAALTRLGVIANLDCELHDIQGWVDKFQEQRSGDGSFQDGIEVAQSYLGSLDT